MARGSFAIVLMLASSVLWAQGLTGGLAGLREALFLLWGAAGIVPAIALAFAFAREKKHPRSVLALFLVLVAFLYALSAISVIFIPSNDLASKFAGFIGFAILFGVVHYVVRESPRLRTGISALLVAVLTGLMIIPNDYWKIPLVSFERVIFVDNLSHLDNAKVLRSHYGYAGRLALDDGRMLIQTQRIPERRAYTSKSGPATFPNGQVVVLEPTSSAEAGQWFEIAHYAQTYVYGMRADGTRSRYLLPLSERTVDRYSPGNRTLGYLLGGSGFDYEGRLIRLVGEQFGSWNSEPERSDPGNKHYWAAQLISQGGLDLRSPELLERIFAAATPRALVSLVQTGLDPVAQDNQGNTVLHIAAARGSLVLLRELLKHDIDPGIKNRRDQTAVDVIQERARRNPRDYPQQHFEKLLNAAG